jgi:hypothetical protein
VASPLLFEELTDVLLRERFHRYFDATQVYEFIAQLITVAVLVEDPIQRPTLTQDPDDDYLVPWLPLRNPTCSCLAIITSST